MKTLQSPTGFAGTSGLFPCNFEENSINLVGLNKEINCLLKILYVFNSGLFWHATLPGETYSFFLQNCFCAKCILELGITFLITHTLFS